jgi:hypothetical protein
MKPRSSVLIALALLIAVTGRISSAETAAQKPEQASPQTRFEPGPGDPRIIAAIASRNRLNAALVTGDLATAETLFAADFVVNSPINRVVDRANVLGRVRSSEIRQEQTVLNIEFAGVRGEYVVLMGEETVRPSGAMPNAGKLVRRRFTDVWRQTDGAWKLAIRQSTIVSVE